MAAPQLPEPVKLFVALLWPEGAGLEQALARLSARWGATDFQGPDRPFDMTNYYEPEMGPRLQRRLISFEKLVDPGALVEAKLVCNAIEDALAVDACRKVNLDVGYLDHNKVVLGSCKFAGQKIYLAQGIWADLVARYSGGRYRPFEWTFPDFRDGRYDHELGQMRQIYLQQRRRKPEN